MTSACQANFNLAFNRNPNQEYHIGDSVVYQGRVYHIIQPHISQADWTPLDTPALWGQGGPAGSEIGKPPVPQDYRTPPPYHRGGEGGDRLAGMGFDRHREDPWEGHRGIPQPEHQRGIPVPEPEPHRGFPEPDRHQGPPHYMPGDRDHDRDWDRKDDHGPEPHRGFPDPEPHRGFPDPERHRGDRDHERDWDRKDEGRDREHHKDRDFGSSNREQVYEAEDRARREAYQGGSHGGGDYRNPTKYNSSAEWIDDARRRAREVNMNGPGEAIFWLLAEPGKIPRHAIQAGEDREGNPTFVSRNFHEGGLHIGWAGLQRAAISYGGGEIPLTTFEVLAGDPRAVRWVASKRRDGRPIEAGYEADGKPLWICQTMIGGQILAGKTAAWDSGGYIANDGREEAVPEYNVLCHS
ncbi:hypothetical protein FRC04_011398 [Tulasnella sp. 424]|nr:hypothetical protein FRC04_011398 [Tulasnella sp. 424]KAG8972628.1 hypothetical protein FRC05_009738 [Tulasnella sp. 425]